MYRKKRERDNISFKLSLLNVTRQQFKVNLIALTRQLDLCLDAEEL